MIFLNVNHKLTKAGSMGRYTMPSVLSLKTLTTHISRTLCLCWLGSQCLHFAQSILQNSTFLAESYGTHLKTMCIPRVDHLNLKYVLRNTWLIKGLFLKKWEMIEQRKLSNVFRMCCHIYLMNAYVFLLIYMIQHQNDEKKNLIHHLSNKAVGAIFENFEVLSVS